MSTKEIADTMKAAALDRFGAPSVIQPHSLPTPQPGAGEILIELHSAGVGIWDADVREGSWKPLGRSKFPFIPGGDGAGIVVAKGTGVRRFQIGDRVWAYDLANRKGGFYAEYVAVKADHAGHIPKRMNLLQAGAGATTGLTALQGVDEHLRVRRNQTILIYGATGAVGTLAVQFAKRKGARVIATATGGNARRLAKRLGADAVFDARSDEAWMELRKIAPDGIDGALVLASGEHLEQCLLTVKRGGRIVYPNGVEPAPRKRRGIRVIAYDAETNATEFGRLERAATEARLRVPVAEEFPLAKAADAHERLEDGHILGRITLRIR